MAPKDAPKLLHGQVKLQKPPVQNFSEILHGGGGQVRVYSLEMLQEGGRFHGGERHLLCVSSP